MSDPITLRAKLSVIDRAISMLDASINSSMDEMQALLDKYIDKTTIQVELLCKMSEDLRDRVNRYRELKTQAASIKKDLGE